MRRFLFTRYGLVAALCNLLAAPLLAEPVTVIAFGDSLTQGYGLPPEEGMVPALQDWLRTHGVEATVINAGVSGDTTLGGAERIGWALGDPADAIVVALGGNDILRGLSPAQARSNLSAILTEAQKAGVKALLVGYPVPANYGGEWQGDMAEVWPSLAQEFKVPLVENILAPITSAPDPAALLQADGIHPNAAGAKLVAEQIGEALAALLVP